MIKPLEPIDALKYFSVGGDLVDFTPHGSGLINTTYFASYNTNGVRRNYILQAINTEIFTNPTELMQNIWSVTEYLNKKCAGKEKTLRIIPTADGEGDLFYKAPDGICWRLYDFVENTVCLDAPRTKADFFESGYAFGNFQHLLADFPAETLFETIPDFHNTPKRFEALIEAEKQDKCKRAAGVQAELDFFKKRESFTHRLIDAERYGELQLRVSHNDTKINNVLFDKDTGKAACVIDLDTVMPGYSVTDFGDAIRFGASTASEDEPDLNKVNLDMERFATYTDGFLKGCQGSLPQKEIMLLPEGAKMMTLECGIRFLTDYLNGDVYFKTTRENQNLDRTRTHIKLVSEMEKSWDDMKRIVASYCK